MKKGIACEPLIPYQACNLKYSGFLRGLTLYQRQWHNPYLLKFHNSWFCQLRKLFLGFSFYEVGMNEERNKGMFKEQLPVLTSISRAWIRFLRLLSALPRYICPFFKTTLMPQRKIFCLVDSIYLTFGDSLSFSSISFVEYCRKAVLRLWLKYGGQTNTFFICS